MLFIDGLGRTRRAYKPGSASGQRISMDTYIQFAVHDMPSWQSFKKRYEGPVEERYPENLAVLRSLVRR